MTITDGKTTPLDHAFKDWEITSDGSHILCVCGWKSSKGVSYDVAHELDAHVAEVLGISVVELKKRSAKAVAGLKGWK